MPASDQSIYLRPNLIPGVRAVVTAADLPVDQVAESLRYQRDNTLAGEKALYAGHAVAAVVASSVHIADEALQLIQVEYELLSPVVEVRQAMGEDAPILHSELRTDELGRKGDQPTNIASHSQIARGDIEKGFAQAATIVERQFNTATVHPGYIEPQSATAQVNPDGQVTIWTTTQAAFNIRDEVANILDIPVGKIRVIPTEIGGGFGGKNNSYLEPLAVLLSKKSGHYPVKITMDYEDVLSGTGPTSASHIWVKVGVDAKGRITAAQARLSYAAGAFPGSPLWGGMPVIFGPYRIENLSGGWL